MCKSKSKPWLNRNPPILISSGRSHGGFKCWKFYVMETGEGYLIASQKYKWDEKLIWGKDKEIMMLWIAEGKTAMRFIYPPKILLKKWRWSPNSFTSFTIKSQGKALSYLSLGLFSISFVGTKELNLASLMVCTS